MIKLQQCVILRKKYPENCSKADCYHIFRYLLMSRLNITIMHRRISKLSFNSPPPLFFPVRRSIQSQNVQHKTFPFFINTYFVKCCALFSDTQFSRVVLGFFVRAFVVSYLAELSIAWDCVSEHYFASVVKFTNSFGLGRCR